MENNNSNNTRRISCKRCQQRKIRCSRTYPCMNCSLAKARCEFRDNDFKRPPVSREYAAALESRVAILEGLLVKIKAAPNGERDAMLEGIDQDHLPLFSPEGAAADDELLLSDAMMKASLQETREGTMIYHGPTSVFNNDVTEQPPPTSSSIASSPFHDSIISLHTPTVRLCIGLFFFWQYPQFMFIDREFFVQEFEQNPTESEFCAPPLIYACCSMGALMSSDPEIQAMSASFARTSEAMLIAQGWSTPRITTVQALLCLAFYEIGKGSLSKGWLLSGMAFRMGQDLGFQRDPTHWEFINNKTVAPSSFYFDSEFRRRLYWGCFLADKIFSLFLGRPTFMHEDDADVDISEPLPHDPPVWENWLFSHELGYLKTMRPAGPKLTLLFNQLIELSRIINDLLSHTFAPKKKDLKARRWTKVSLNKLNARLVAWHEALPSDMRWKKWFTAKDILQPNVSVLHTLYHSTRICLNLPFITTPEHQQPASSDNTPEAPSRPSHVSESIKICGSSAESIVEILQRFRSQHTLGNAPILFVYGAIVATNSVLVTSRYSPDPPPLVRDTPLPALDSHLQEMSASWALAGEARAKFRRALSLRHRQAAEQDTPAVPPPPPAVHAAASTARGDDGSIRVASEPPIDPRLAALAGTDDRGQPAYAQPHHPSPEISFKSPEHHVWDPMSVVDGEALYWSNMGPDFLAGSETDFMNGLTDLEWLDHPPKMP